MDIEFLLARYVLNKLDWYELPSIALNALEQNIECESWIILAGLTDKDPTNTRQLYFENGILELGYRMPNKTEAQLLMLKHNLQCLISYPEKAVHYAEKIDQDYYLPYFYTPKKSASESRYVGDEIGLEKFFMWYRELQDHADGGPIFYYRRLPRDQQKSQFIFELVMESKELVNSERFNIKLKK